jgi:antitoxin HicB
MKARFFPRTAFANSAPQGFVDLEDTFTEGATLDEALFNAAEVLSTMLGCRLDHDLPIPDPSPAGEGMTLIAPDARTQAALLIRRARGDRSLVVALGLVRRWRPLLEVRAGYV